MEHWDPIGSHAIEENVSRRDSCSNAHRSSKDGSFSVETVLSTFSYMRTIF